MSKSTILGMGVEDEMVSSMETSMGCEVGVWPTKYLSMSLGGNLCSGAF